MLDESLSLYQLVERAKVEHPCSQGHDWQSIGGRACSLYETEDPPELCKGSQTVYECYRCGEVDYGEKPGPGYDDCVGYCRRKE